MITDEPPMQRIWSCLHAILCDSVSAQDICSTLTYDTADAFGYLTPLSVLKNTHPTPPQLEEKIEEIENAADSAAADLSDIHRYTRLIRGALDELRKEEGND